MRKRMKKTNVFRAVEKSLTLFNMFLVCSGLQRRISSHLHVHADSCARFCMGEDAKTLNRNEPKVDRKKVGLCRIAEPRVRTCSECKPLQTFANHLS